MLADNLRRCVNGSNSSGGSNSGTPVLLATYTTSGYFIVPSGYSSFKIELIGGKGGDGTLSVQTWGGYGHGGNGAKITFTVPVSDMAVGTFQTFTVGVNGADSGSWKDGLDGSDSIFMGMTATGGCGGGEMIGNGANGSSICTTYTNTTPNQTGTSASMKVYGIA